jgi:hypothetical protein
LSARKLLEQERSADGIHVTEGHNNIRSVLRNTKKLCRAIQNNKHGMLTSSAVFLHDNARPHVSTAARTQALLEHFNWELFDHPSYNPVVTPNDYHLFTYPKNL